MSTLETLLIISWLILPFSIGAAAYSLITENKKP